MIALVLGNRRIVAKGPRAENSNHRARPHLLNSIWAESRNGSDFVGKILEVMAHHERGINIDKAHGLNLGDGHVDRFEGPFNGLAKRRRKNTLPGAKTAVTNQRLATGPQ